MLNLAYVFDDAIYVLREHCLYLSVNSLPATIYLMQRDVINHYRYAISHYLPLSLTEPFLQNSSIGSPYEKWAKFTNSDFDMLSKRIEILMQYTVRMIHGIDRARINSALDESKFSVDFTTLLQETRQRTDKYQWPLGDLKYEGEKIGLRVEPESKIVMTRLSYSRENPSQLTIEHNNGVTTNKLTSTDEEGNQHIQIVSDQVARERMKVLKGETIDISDRRTIKKLQEEARSEVSNLEAKNAQFAESCKLFLKKREVVQPFDDMFDEWIQ